MRTVGSVGCLSNFHFLKRTSQKYLPAQPHFSPWMIYEVLVRKIILLIFKFKSAINLFLSLIRLHSRLFCFFFLQSDHLLKLFSNVSWNILKISTFSQLGRRICWFLFSFPRIKRRWWNLCHGIQMLCKFAVGTRLHLLEEHWIKSITF